jgi:hypothetical protein
MLPVILDIHRPYKTLGVVLNNVSEHTIFGTR